MRLSGKRAWIPLALVAATLAACASTQAQAPAPYNYHEPNQGRGAGDPDGPGSCYVESLNGRICRD